MNGDIPVPGDYDGDGITDYAFWRPSVGGWFIVPSSTGNAYAIALGATGMIPVPGDYDGDGKTDLAIWIPSNGEWVIVLSSNGQTVSQQWGLTGDTPIVGDFDGDGKTDYAVWRPSNVTWYILYSSTGQNDSRQWGLPGDIALTGDFDGDGKSDLTIWRPSNGTWFIIPSSNPETGSNPDSQIQQQFGLTGDVPIPGDYDRDGTTDFAVWRPGNQTYYLYPTTTQQTLVVPWGTSGDIPSFPSPGAHMLAANPSGGASAVQIKDLTNPAIAPNFEDGDSFQITIWGPPNQPVYLSRAYSGSSSTTQIGQIGSSGHLQFTGTQSNSSGTYTDVYTVGPNQAGPAFTYVVGPSGGVGWISTGESAETPDGSVGAFSSLSISNGTSIYTYSATYFGYSTSTYYDVQTVATLYQSDQPIQQAIAADSSDAQGSLTATAYPFTDYTLQTDHYVTALIPIGGEYYNPDYFADGSCDDDSGDCSIGPEDGPVEVAAAAIYLGSTVADQTAIPTNASAFAPQLPPGIVQTRGMVLQLALITKVFEKLVADAMDVGDNFNDTQIPFLVQLVGPSQKGDRYIVNGVGLTERQRTYIVKDIYGEPWNQTNPLLIHEQFEQTGISPLGIPDANGLWVSQASYSTYQALEPQKMTNSSQMLDFYAYVGGLTTGSSVQFNQYYYASNFNIPTWWNLPNPLWNGNLAQWPLWIEDDYNNCTHGNQRTPGAPTLFPGQTLTLATTGIGVDGDNGPPLTSTGIVRPSTCGNPTLP